MPRPSPVLFGFIVVAAALSLLYVGLRALFPEADVDQAIPSVRTCLTLIVSTAAYFVASKFFCWCRNEDFELIEW